MEAFCLSPTVTVFPLRGRTSSKRFISQLTNSPSTALSIISDDDHDHDAPSLVSVPSDSQLLYRPHFQAARARLAIPMATVSVHALDAGFLTIPEKFLVVPSDPEAKFTVPSMSFLIQHQTSDAEITRLVFDLGLRHDITLYPEVLQKHCQSRQPMSTTPDVVASLAKGGLQPADIDMVIFSHVHYDHVGYPADFPTSRYIVGPGALDLLSGKTSFDIGSHSFFEPDLLDLSRTTELPSPASHSSSPPFTWKSVGPFPHAIDLFGDNSVYIINAPGHLPGHINLLCRLPPGEYVYLAGDACHDIRLFTGEREIATWTDLSGKYCCIHADIDETKQTLVRIRQAVEEGVDGAGVEVVFAHNWAWEAEAKEKGRFWPGQL